MADQRETDQIPVVPTEVIPKKFEKGQAQVNPALTETRLDFVPPTPAEVVSKMSSQYRQAYPVAEQDDGSGRPWIDAGPPPGSPSRPRRQRRQPLQERTIILWLLSVFAAFIGGMAFVLIFVV